MTFSCLNILLISLARIVYFSIFSLFLSGILPLLGNATSIRYVRIFFLFVSEISGLLTSSILIVRMGLSSIFCNYIVYCIF